TNPIIPPGAERGGHRSIDAIIEELISHGSIKDCIAHVHRLEPVAAKYGEWPASLDERLRNALIKRGIERPYTHQATAIDHAIHGRNTVVITPTASGKSICYNVPVVNEILKDPAS